MAKFVRFSLKGFKAFRRDAPKILRKVEREIAMAAPRHIVRNIKKGKTGIYPNDNLPFNKPSTIRRKGHGERLIDEKKLTIVGDWEITKGRGGYLVKPPAVRREAVKHLNDRTENRPAYKILEIPSGFFPKWAQTILTKEVRKFLAKFG